MQHIQDKILRSYLRLHPITPSCTDHPRSFPHEPNIHPLSPQELQRRLAAHFDRINDPLNEEPEAPYELAALEVALESVAKYMEG